jgi:hypothetical protein
MGMATDASGTKEITLEHSSARSSRVLNRTWPTGIRSSYAGEQLQIAVGRRISIDDGRTWCAKDRPVAEGHNPTQQRRQEGRMMGLLDEYPFTMLVLTIIVILLVVSI